MRSSLAGYFRHRLVLVAGIGLLPLLLLHGYVLHTAFSQARTEASSGLHAASASGAAHLQKYLQRLSYHLRATVQPAQGPTALQNGEAEQPLSACDSLLLEAQEADVVLEQVLLFYENGALVCSASQGPTPGWSGLDPPAEFARILRSASPALFTVPGSATVPLARAALSQPLTHQGRRAVAVAVLPQKSLLALLRTPALDERTTIFITDASSLLLAQYPEQALSPSQAAKLATAQVLPDGTALKQTSLGPAGAPRSFFVSTYPVGGTDLRVVAVLASDEVDAAARRQAWVSASAVLAALALGALLSTLVAQHLARSASSLLATLHALKNGSPRSRANECLPGAFGEMAHALNELTDQRNEAIAGLAASSAQMRRLAGLYAARSAASHAAGQRLEPPGLYAEICRICIEHLGARSAWFGLVTPQGVEVVAQCGQVSTFLADREPPALLLPRLQRDSGAQAQEMPGSTGFAVRRDDGSVFGVLNLHYADLEALQPDLVHLVGQICEEIARAVKVSEQEAKQAAAARALCEAELARRQRSLAEQANRAKTEFLSRISHELRSPLNAVLGFTQLLQLAARDKLDEEDRHKLDLISVAGTQLRALIEDVLDVSLIEAGHLALDLQEVEVAATVGSVLHMSEAQACERGITLRVCADQAACAAVAHTDPVRLRQVLFNLVSNAIKYNKRGGQVTVSVMASQKHVEIGVCDTGLGMSAAQLSQLFQPFNRLGRERSEVPGTGIGLVLVRQLVALLGGSLEIQSTEGEGTLARVTLPLCTRGTAPARDEALAPSLP